MSQVPDEVETGLDKTLAALRQANAAAYQQNESVASAGASGALDGNDTSSSDDDDAQASGQAQAEAKAQASGHRRGMHHGYSDSDDDSASWTSSDDESRGSAYMIRAGPKKHSRGRVSARAQATELVKAMSKLGMDEVDDKATIAARQKLESKAREILSRGKASGPRASHHEDYYGEPVPDKGSDAYRREVDRDEYVLRRAGGRWYYSMGDRMMYVDDDDARIFTGPGGRRMIRVATKYSAAKTRRDTKAEALYVIRPGHHHHHQYDDDYYGEPVPPKGSDAYRREVDRDEADLRHHHHHHRRPSSWYPRYDEPNVVRFSRGQRAAPKAASHFIR